MNSKKIRGSFTLFVLGSLKTVLYLESECLYLEGGDFYSSPILNLPETIIWIPKMVLEYVIMFSSHKVSLFILKKWSKMKHV